VSIRTRDQGGPEAVSAALDRHVRSFFSGRRMQVVAAEPHATELVPGLRTLEVEPGRGESLWTYVSIGAWQVQPENASRIEFLMISPRQSHRVALLVQMAAYYHATPDASFQLGLGHTLPIGEPWLDDSASEHLLVSKPYPFGPALEVFEDQGTHVHLYWLLPITERERAFNAAKGLEALEALFEQAGLEYWRPDRSSIVTD
jgi:hypothetical protein